MVSCGQTSFICPNQESADATIVSRYPWCRKPHLGSLGRGRAYLPPFADCVLIKPIVLWPRPFQTFCAVLVTRPCTRTSSSTFPAPCLHVASWAFQLHYVISSNVLWKAERVGQGEVGGFTLRMSAARLHLGLAVERPWFALFGAHFSATCTPGWHLPGALIASSLGGGWVGESCICLGWLKPKNSYGDTEGGDREAGSGSGWDS